MIRSLLVALAIAGMAVGQAEAKLLAFWNFNNSFDDNDNLNANGDGGGDGGFNFMYDNDPSFDDGWYDPSLDRMYPVHDNFAGETYDALLGPGDPGALVDQNAFPNGVGVPSASVVNSMFDAYLDVSNLMGDGSFNASGGDINDFGSFAGTTLNEPGTPFAGGSLSPTGSGNNGRSFQIVADLTNFQNVSVSWAQRGTGTGYNSRVVAVSTDGVNYTNILTQSGTLSATFATSTVTDLGNILAGATTAYIRFTINGATTTNGNNRFDNIVLRGDDFSAPAVPEPTAALVFVGLGMCHVLARRVRPSATV